MAYSTQDQVQTAVGGPDKLAQLSDLSNTGSPAIVPAVVSAAIAEADGEINSMIGHRYAVPLTTVPDLIAAKSAAWAARILRRNKYNGQPLPDDIDRERMDRDWLKLVANGTASLGIEPTPGAASIVTDKATTRDSTKLMSRDRLRGVIW